MGKPLLNERRHRGKIGKCAAGSIYTHFFPFLIKTRAIILPL